MMEAIRSSETSVLTRSKLRNILEDGILQCTSVLRTEIVSLAALSEGLIAWPSFQVASPLSQVMYAELVARGSV
jgi:hypothetical protein